MPISSEELLSRWVLSDNEAGDTLYERHDPQLRRVIRKKAKLWNDPRSVEDLSGDTWLELFKAATNPDPANPINSVGAWLCRAAECNAIDYMRKTLGDEAGERDKKLDTLMRLFGGLLSRFRGLNHLSRVVQDVESAIRDVCSKKPAKRYKTISPQEESTFIENGIIWSSTSSKIDGRPLYSGDAGWPATDSNHEHERAQELAGARIDLDTFTARLTQGERDALHTVVRPVYQTDWLGIHVDFWLTRHIYLDPPAISESAELLGISNRTFTRDRDSADNRLFDFRLLDYCRYTDFPASMELWQRKAYIASRSSSYRDQFAQNSDGWLPKPGTPLTATMVRFKQRVMVRFKERARLISEQRLRGIEYRVGGPELQVHSSYLWFYGPSFDVKERSDSEFQERMQDIEDGCYRFWDRWKSVNGELIRIDPKSKSRVPAPKTDFSGKRARPATRRAASPMTIAEHPKPHKAGSARFTRTIDGLASEIVQSYPAEFVEELRAELVRLSTSPAP